MNSGGMPSPRRARVIRGEADDLLPGSRRGPGALHELIERRDRARRSAPAIVAIVATSAATLPLWSSSWTRLGGRWDIRISVTDRCNFRCVYCMPKEVFGRDYPFLPREGSSPSRRSREWRAPSPASAWRRSGSRAASRWCAATWRRWLGSGADRRARPDADHQRRPPRPQGDRPEGGGAEPHHGQPRLAGRRRLPRHERRRLPGHAGARRGSTRARRDRPRAGEVNVVVKRGLNEDGVLPMARHFRGTEVVLRFIEYMDVGHTNGWRLDDVVPAAEIVAAIDAELPLGARRAAYRGEVANRWRYRDGSGEIGIVSSVTQPFCGDCTRARLGRRPGLHLPLRREGPRSARPPARRRLRRGAVRRAGGHLAREATATRSSARQRPPSCPRSRCRTSAARATSSVASGALDWGKTEPTLR